jgi:hypothetical protein
MRLDENRDNADSKSSGNPAQPAGQVTERGELELINSSMGAIG